MIMSQKQRSHILIFTHYQVNALKKMMLYYNNSIVLTENNFLIQ